VVAVDGGNQARGYLGCYAGLAKLLAPWRGPAPTPGDTPLDQTPIPSEAPIAHVPVRHVSPQIAAALLSQPRPLLSDRQAETVDALKEQCPGFTTCVAWS